MDLTYSILFFFMIVLGTTKETPGSQCVLDDILDGTVLDADGLFEILKRSNSKSLLKKYLTKAVVNNLKNKTTAYGGTLAHCIKSGCLNTENNCGLFASDPDAYNDFTDIFDPIIRDYHKVSDFKHPEPDFGDLNSLGFDDLDPTGAMINSVTIRVDRSHANYGFPPTTCKEARLEMENKTVRALKTLRGKLRGTYFPLRTMTREVKKQMEEDHFLFKDDDRFLSDANVYDDWPEGRGIFTSEDKKFLVWVNEEDHLRIISMQQGGDLAEGWKTVVKGLKNLEKKLTFAHHPKFGYLTFSPTNLGTALKVSVRIKIPNLSKREDFDGICDGLSLQPQGIHSEHPESKGGWYDISNKRRMGLSEIEVVQEMRTGVEKIIEFEKKLASGGKI